MRSLFSGTIAVSGSGRPNGCRNSATTANQSARPPISDASAKNCHSGELGICALQASADDKQYPHQRKQGERDQFNASQAVPLLQLIHCPPR